MSATHYPDHEGLQLSVQHGLYPNQDHEGLQFSADHGLYPNQDHEGLQAVPSYHSGVSKNSDSPPKYPVDAPNEKLFPKSAAVNAFRPPAGDAEAGDKSRPKRRRWLIGAICIIIIVALAVGLGAGLGTKYHQLAQANAQSAAADGSTSGSGSNSNSASTISTARVRSTSGTWNGTGIHNFQLDKTDDNIGFIAFQDYTGAVLTAPWKMSSPSSGITLTAPAAKLNIKAANGTGITGELFPNGDIFSSQLVYVNQDGILADVWQQDSPFGAWVDGNLTSVGIKAPTDNRPAMYLSFDPLGGEKFGQLALRLYAGGTDGQMHQYSGDQVSGSWYPYATHNFSNSWAYGGVRADQFSWSGWDHSKVPVGTPLFNISVCMTDQDGTIRAYTQVNDAQNTTEWPLGGPWTQSVSSGQKTSPNSSFAYSQTWNGWNATHMYALYASADASPSLGAVEWWPNPASNTTSLGNRFGATSTMLKQNPVIQGSDFTYQGSMNRTSLIFYQDNGTSIAWAVIDTNGDDVVSAGHIKADQTGAWAIGS